MTVRLTHLDRLEAESIHIHARGRRRSADNPVMLYSVGKDSAVMLHLAKQGVLPGEAPLSAAPRRHDVEVQGDVRAARKGGARQAGMELLVHRNPEALARGINPFDHGALHTNLWKTAGAQAGTQTSTASTRRSAGRGATRKRAAPRSASSRSARRAIAGIPRTSGPSCGTCTTRERHKGESIRVFPLSNWTELDIWQLHPARGKHTRSCRSTLPRPRPVVDA